MTKFEKVPVLRVFVAIFLLNGLSVLSSCGGDDEEPVTPPEPEPEKITVNLSATHQEMIGFGGALTWYSDRVISSSKKKKKRKAAKGVSCFKVGSQMLKSVC